MNTEFKFTADDSELIAFVIRSDEGIATLEQRSQDLSDSMTKAFKQSGASLQEQEQLFKKVSTSIIKTKEETKRLQTEQQKLNEERKRGIGNLKIFGVRLQDLVKVRQSETKAIDSNRQQIENEIKSRKAIIKALESDIAAIEKVNKSLNQNSSLLKRNNSLLDQKRKRLAAEEKALLLLSQQQNKQSKATQKAAKGSRSFGRAIGTISRAATKFLAVGLLGALSALVGIFLKSEQGAKLFRKGLAAMDAVTDVLASRMGKLYDGLVNIFSGNFKKGFSDLKQSISGVASEMKAATSQATALEGAMIRLEKAQLDFELSTIRNKGKIIELNNVINDGNISIRERKKAVEELATLQTKSTNEQIKLQEEQTALALGYVEVTQDVIKNVNDFIKAGKKAEDLEGIAFGGKVKNIERAKTELQKLAELQNQTLVLQFERQAEINNLNSEARRIFEEKRKAQEQLKNEYLNTLEVLEQQIQSERLAALEGIERIEAQRKLALDQVSNLEDQLKKQAQAARKSFLQEKEFAELRKLVNQRADKEITAFRVAELEQQKKAQEDQFKSLEKATDDFLSEQDRRFANRLKVIAEDQSVTLRAIEFDDSKTEEEKAESQLEATIFFLQKKRKVLVEQFNENSPKVRLLDFDIAEAEQQLEELNGNVKPLLQRLKDSILDTFQITEEELNIITGLLGDTLSNFTDARTAAIEREIDAQEKLIQGLSAKVTETKSLLQQEQDAYNKGNANNLRSTKERLAAEEKALREAEEKKLKLEEKAAKRRLLIDSLQQASSIALAGAQLVAAEASKGLVGIITALSGVALIAKVVSKAKGIAQQFSAPPTFFKGANLDKFFSGQTKRGNKKEFPAMTKHGDPLILHGDEYVMPNQPAKEHLSLLEDMHKGKYAGIDLKHIIDEAIKPGALMTRQTLPTDRINRMNQKHIIIKEKSNNALTESNVRDIIEQQTGEILTYWKRQPQVTPTPWGYVKRTDDGLNVKEEIVKIKT